MIRPFRRVDTDAVIGMIQELRDEVPHLLGMPLEPAHIAQLMNSFTVRGWVAEGEDGGLRGYCFATVVPSLLGPGRICTDLSVFVRKPYRNGLIAMRFVQAMEAYGRELGCVMHQHVISTGNPGIERIYERLGYTRTGGCFIRVAPA